MPILPRLTRRRLFVAGLLLLVNVSVSALVLTAQGPMEVARAKYDHIQVCMTRKEVDAIMGGWFPEPITSSGTGYSVDWFGSDGASIHVFFNWDGRVSDKHFDEGDQSFRAKVGRFRDRLTDKLHLGP
jgi:hypothetical protein